MRNSKHMVSAHTQLDILVVRRVVMCVAENRHVCVAACGSCVGFGALPGEH